VQRGFTADLVFNGTDYTATFTGLGAQTGLAATADAAIVFDPNALAAVDPPVALTVGYAAGAVASAAGDCTQAFRPNEAQGVSRSLINVANAGSDLTVNGVSQPGASLTGVTLIDSTGKSVSAIGAGAGTWTANVPASSLAGLADGAIKVASTYTIGAGKTIGGLLKKDTTAPAAPNASVAAGTYSSTQSVALSAAEGTIYYTTDGSDPSTSSAKYSKAIDVADSRTIKAVAVDAAGNLSPVASFGYTIAKPAAVLPVLPVPSIKAPKLKLDALTIGSRYSLRTVRRNGLRIVIFAPEGAKVVKIRLLRNGHVITRTVRKVRGDGVMTVVLPSTKKGRRKLRRGTYKLQVTPGSSPANYGATTTRTIRIR
jgi:hypothetical protein